MSLGVCLAVASTYFAFRPSLSNSPISAKESAFAAAAIGSFYCLAGLSAILYPLADWSDPEYAHGGEQRVVFAGIPVMMWIGYALEVNRIGKAKKS